MKIRSSPTLLACLWAFDGELAEMAPGLGATPGIVLVVGTGSGQIPIKLARRNIIIVLHAIDMFGV